MFSIPTDLSALPPLPPWALPVGIAALAYGARKIWMICSRQKGLPPGPPTVPILGNLNVLPREYLHLKFTEWGMCIPLKLDSPCTNLQYSKGVWRCFLA